MKDNFYPGKFIVIDGLDGCGKSTQVELLADLLTKKGVETVITKEPTQDSVAGRKIRDILNKKYQVSSSKLQILFCQDREEHLKNLIIPALQKGKIVRLRSSPAEPFASIGIEHPLDHFLPELVHLCRRQFHSMR